METLEELQKKKLSLEIADLARPSARRPAFWISIASAVIAIGGVWGQNYLSKIESKSAKLEVQQLSAQVQPLSTQVHGLQSQVQSLEAQRHDLLNEIAALNETRVNISKSNAALRQITEAKNLSPKDNLVVAQSRNAAFWIGIIGYQVPRKEVTKIQNTLSAEGYTIKFGGMMSERQPWLAVEPSVLYYSSQSAKMAADVAAKLSNLTGKRFLAKLGKGYDVPTEQRDWRLYVHDV